MQKKLSLFVVALVGTISLFIGAASAQDANSGGVWREIDDSALRARNVQRRLVPRFHKAFRLDNARLSAVLDRAPREFSEAARTAETILTLPMPDGSLLRFRIEASPIMEPELAAKYTEIQSYRGQGIDNPTATARFDISMNGFRAMILSNQGTVFVEPYSWGDKQNYISFYKSDVTRTDQWSCLVGGENLVMQPEEFNFLPAPEIASGATLRTYRLAMAATGEYTNVFRQTGDTDAQARARALAAINTSMNRVNQVYERDVQVRMVLIANTDLLIYTDPATDPYTNSSGSTMLSQNQTNIDTVIGTANYDIGHVFSTGGGGVANLNGPCSPTLKARGVTGQPNPVGDPFDIDYVAHEIGHQFGANHTFNGCGTSQRSASSAYEPGSGITIMAYAGLCGSQNLSANSIETFHVKSIEAIIAFTTNGNGNTCAVQSPTGNTPPVIAAPGVTSYNIPKQTPFTLSATATDADNDSITYDWQQYDLGSNATVVPNSDADGNARPIFRPFLPKTEGSRTFPALTHILNSENVPPNTTGGFMTGELLPSITRTMNFKVIARDNRASGGGVQTATLQVVVDSNSGPFALTAPNTNVTWAGNSTQTVTWNAANTAAAPVNAASVKITLSTDGGQTFPTTLLSSTPNDGSETITVPNIATARARIRIEAVNNIFFDISNANFTITASTSAAPRTLHDFDGDGKSDISVFRPQGGTWFMLRSQDGFTAAQFGISTDKTVAADYDGDRRTDVAVFRNGTWFWLNSSNGAFNAVQFGLAQDKPVTGDYDGDGRTDLAVYRDGVWFILQSGNGAVRAEQFGLASDKPVTGDFDGDGRADLAVFRPTDGTWYVMRSQLGFTGAQFGISTDSPAPADYDGDGKSDFAVYRDGTWFVLRSQLGFTAVQFGLASDIPAPGDFDGDAKADISVFRPTDGTWYQLRSQAGFTAARFGTGGDTPVQAPLY